MTSLCIGKKNEANDRQGLEFRFGQVLPQLAVAQHFVSAYYLKWYFVSKTVLTYCEKRSLVLQDLRQQRFLRSNTLEQFKFNLEKIIGIYKPKEKLEKMIFYFFELNCKHCFCQFPDVCVFVHKGFFHKTTFFTYYQTSP